MDAVSEETRETVVVMKAAQVGWTEILNNTLGFFIDQDPAPCLVIQPTGEMAAVWSKDRFAPMIRDTPVLRKKIHEAKSRDSDNTIWHKTFTGGHVSIIGANSPVGLASRPIRVVLADEVDRYPLSAGSEGDPLKLAAKRQETFWNRKTLIGSTPTVKGVSVVEREFERSDKRYYHVACGACGHEQVLHWKQVHWNKTDDGEHLPATAHYACEECGHLWDDAERWRAIRTRGRWIATHPERPVAGFHISGFMSSWLTLERIVREFLEARKNPHLLQVWVNTVLGESWEADSERVESGTLANRGEAYDGQSLPEEVAAIFAGVDVQDNRLEVQLIGWAADEQTYPFRYEVIHGDPAQPTVWETLDEILLDTYRTRDGRALRVRGACVDSGGHHAAAVFAFCRKRRRRGVFATKGVGGPKPIWPKRASRATKSNDEVFMIGVDTAKDSIYGRLRIAKPGPNYIHFPAGLGFDEAYFAQLTAETVVTRYREGRPYRVWTLTPGVRNEALDTFVLAMAARQSVPRQFSTAASRPPPPPEPADPPLVADPDDDKPDPPPAKPWADVRPEAVQQARRGGRRVSRSSYMGR